MKIRKYQVSFTLFQNTSIYNNTNKQFESSCCYISYLSIEIFSLRFEKNFKFLNINGDIIDILPYCGLNLCTIIPNLAKYIRSSIIKPFLRWKCTVIEAEVDHKLDDVMV